MDAQNNWISVNAVLPNPQDLVQIHDADVGFTAGHCIGGVWKEGRVPSDNSRILKSVIEWRHI